MADVQTNSSCEMDSLDGKHQKKLMKQDAHSGGKNRIIMFLKGKKFLIAFSTINVIILWIFLITPLIVLVGKVAPNNQLQQNTIFNLLPPINVTSNYSNFTIQRVDCVDDFVYEPRDEMCYPDCDWNPARDDSVKIIRLFLGIFSVFSLALGTATLIAWVLTSCIDWKRVRFHYDFQLPRTSLFMVVLCSLFLIVITASFDLMPRDEIFCYYTEDGQPYLLAHLFFSISNVEYIKVRINVIGALAHYSFLVTITWVTISLLNISVIVFSPQLKKSFNKRVAIFLFQCIFCFGFNLLPIAIVVALEPESPYLTSYPVSFMGFGNPLGFIFLFIMPYFIIPGVVITLTVVIVTKLRITSLRSGELTGNKIKLTDLEKRLIIYTSVLMVIVFLQGFGFILLSALAPGYTDIITDFILCMTVNSPILTLPNGTNTTLNSTVSVYRENPYGDVDACRMLESEADSQLPQILTSTMSIFFRLIWLPLFVILIPIITPKLVRSWISSLKDKLSS